MAEKRPKTIERNGTMLAVARHEAAHAVIGELLGFRCLSVEIHGPQSGVHRWDGRCRRAPGIIAHAVVALAGCAAEQLWHRMHPGYVSEEDGKGLLAMGFTMQDFPPAMYLARRIVRANRAAIWRVALALIENGKLTGAQVRDLAAGADGGADD